MVNKELIEQWLKDLENEEFENRYQRIHDLGTYWKESDKIIPTLTKTLVKDTDTQNQIAILNIIRRNAKEMNLPFDTIFDIMINNENLAVKAMTNEVLAKIITKEKLPKLNEFLVNRDIDLNTQICVVNLVGDLKSEGKESAKLIFNLINEDVHIKVKTKAISSLGKIACDDYRKELLEILSNNEDRNLRIAAANALRNLKIVNKETIDTLLRIMKNEKDVFVKKTIIITLSLIGSDFSDIIIPEFLTISKTEEDSNLRVNTLLAANRLDIENFPFLLVDEINQEMNATKKKRVYSSLDPLVKELECKNREEFMALYKRNNVKDRGKNLELIEKIPIPSKDEIKEICKKGESQIHEFKSKGIEATKLSKEICAFANTKSGGLIFYGVEDDGTIKGSDITTQELDPQLQNSIKNNIYPTIVIDLFQKEVNSVEIIIIRIPPWNRSDVYHFNDRVVISIGTNAFYAKDEQSKKLHSGTYIS